MASVLIISEDLDSGGKLARRMTQEGHITKLWTRGVSRGLDDIKRVKSPRALIEQYDLIISTGNIGDICDELKTLNASVIGGSNFHDRINFDSDYRDRVINTLIKLEGSASDRGITVTTTGWFDGKDWLPPFSHSLKQRRLMNGDYGPLTDSMGEVLWPSGSNKLTAMTLDPLKPLLEKVNFIGPISSSATVDEESITHEGLHAGFDINTLGAWCELIRVSLFDYLYSLVERSDKTYNSFDEYAISISLKPSIGEYLEDSDLEIPEQALKHIWICDTCEITARGSSVRECQRRTYRTVNNVLRSRDILLRTDIGNKADETRYQLKDWGWVQ